MPANTAPGIYDSCYSSIRLYGRGFDVSVVYAVATQLDGKAVVGGTFTSYRGVARSKVARLNLDGSLDQTFNPGAGANTQVSAIVVQPDGKIIIGGAFDRFDNNTAARRVARLNPNGSLDATFNIDARMAFSADQFVQAIAYQADGKILIGGDFDYTLNNVNYYNLARLNSDGSFDETFAQTVRPVFSTAIIEAIALQQDGKILLGGDIVDLNGQHSYRLGRINPDGTIDAGFTTMNGSRSTLDGIVQAIAVQLDGKILVGGKFENYNTTPRNHLARLNADGTLDPTFNPGAGTVNNLGSANAINTILVQPTANGRILVGGYFFLYDGVQARHVVRLQSNGARDNTFNGNSRIALNGDVQAMAFQPDGKVLLGGSFQNCGTCAPSGEPTALMRVFAYDGSQVATEDMLSTPEALAAYPNPAQGTVSVKAGKPMSRIRILNAEGRLVYEQSLKQTRADAVRLPLAGWPAGLYFVEAEAADGALLRTRVAVQ